MQLALIPADPLGWLLLDGRQRTQAQTLRHAAFVHAVYRAHNGLRHDSQCSHGAERIWSEARGLAMQHAALRSVL